VGNKDDDVEGKEYVQTRIQHKSDDADEERETSTSRPPSNQEEIIYRMFKYRMFKCNCARVQEKTSNE
jgi:hypothetical protein